MSSNCSNLRRDSCSSVASSMAPALQDHAPPLSQPRLAQQQRPLQTRFKTTIEPQLMSSSWLTGRILRNSDVSLRAADNNVNNNENVNANNNFAGNGDICLFHYPTTYLPKLSTDEMRRAFELIAELGRVHDSEDGTEVNYVLNNQVEVVQGRITNMDLQGDFHRFVVNSSERARSSIARIQFSWYQFEAFPRDVVGRTYGNLRHVDIRQNASLTCIESIITQLPHLSSLNLSDCPNLCTLAPIAKYALQDDESDTLNDHEEQLGVNELPNQQQRNLSLRHLWIRGCNLSTMSKTEWSAVFEALSQSSGPLERMTLSRNHMRYLEGGIGKLESLSYLFVEDNHFVRDGSNLCDDGRGFELPMELGSLSSLRFLSLCGNNITHLPQSMGRLNPHCDIHLHRNPNLVYPPAPHATSVKSMRDFFHRERMALFCGTALFLPYVKRGRFRANERLYRPGGTGYFACKDRFEEAVRRNTFVV